MLKFHSCCIISLSTKQHKFAHIQYQQKEFALEWPRACTHTRTHTHTLLPESEKFSVPRGSTVLTSVISEGKRPLHLPHMGRVLSPCTKQHKYSCYQPQVDPLPHQPPGSALSSDRAETKYENTAQRGENVKERWRTAY